MLDDTDSDKWIDYILHGEKVIIYDDKLLFRDTGVLFTIKGDILSMITEYEYNKTDFRDAKKIITLLGEMHFDKHANGKSSRE